MRLLKVSSFERGRVGGLELAEFHGTRIPRYAILSHTWTDDEVLFQDIKDHTASQRRAYDKLELAASQARSDSYEWLWVDTCCIDKSSSTELQEAINSMFQWYEGAGICYAYLADVPSPTGEDGHQDDQSNSRNGEFEMAVINSRWFKRGWTLQELVAPADVVFYSQDWIQLGELAKGDNVRAEELTEARQSTTALRFRSIVATVTGIHMNYLDGSKSIQEASIATRMSWASDRETTRDEDIAYCLMGIFKVNMPLLYGEGHNAFIRLQEEIMKHSGDHSLFAWQLRNAALHHRDKRAFSKATAKTEHELSRLLGRHMSKQRYIKIACNAIIATGSNEFVGPQMPGNPPKSQKINAESPQDTNSPEERGQILVLPLRFKSHLCKNDFHGLLASHPRAFKDSQELSSYADNSMSSNSPYTTTNRGIQIELSLSPVDDGMFIALLNCGGDPNARLGIYVRPYSNESDQYCRILCDRIAVLEKKEKLFPWNYQMDPSLEHDAPQTILVSQRVEHENWELAPRPQCNILFGLGFAKLFRIIKFAGWSLDHTAACQVRRQDFGSKWENIPILFDLSEVCLAFAIELQHLETGKRLLLACGSLLGQTIGFFGSSLDEGEVLADEIFESDPMHWRKHICLSPVREQCFLEGDMFLSAKLIPNDIPTMALLLKGHEIDSLGVGYVRPLYRDTTEALLEATYTKDMKPNRWRRFRKRLWK